MCVLFPCSSVHLVLSVFHTSRDPSVWRAGPDDLRTEVGPAAAPAFVQPVEETRPLLPAARGRVWLRHDGPRRDVDLDHPAGLVEPAHPGGLHRVLRGRVDADRPLRGVEFLSLDRRARRATLEGETVDLTPKALAVLEYLMTHPDEAISRERLLEAVWGWEYPAGTRTVDTRMAELRRALDDDPASPRFIETISGEGYRFIAKVEAEG